MALEKIDNFQKYYRLINIEFEERIFERNIKNLCINYKNEIKKI